MLRSFWTKALRERRLALVGWGVGLAALAFGILLLHPALARTAGIGDYVESLPPVLLVVLGESDLLSAAGFVNAELFHFLVPFVLISCAVGVGADHLAGKREHRALELLLSLPVSRTRYVLEGYVAIAGVVSVLGLALFGGMALGVARTGVDLELANLAGATASACLLALLFGTLALLLGCFTARRGLCTAVAITLVTGSFLLRTLGEAIPVLEPLRRASPFTYYRWGDPVRHGLHAPAALVLLLGSLVLLWATAAVLRRRDLA